MLSRRQFLGAAGGTAAAIAAGAVGWERLVDQHLDRAVEPVGSTEGAATGSAIDGRVLVVVQLSGGNDGINTLIPAGDGHYFDARPTLGVKDANVVALAGTDRYGLHPAMAPLAGRWARGHLAAIDGVGFPGQTRSHFSALDTWWSATPGESVRTGWLGRWLDATGDPTNPLRAVALGGGSPALVGERARSTVVLDPSGFRLLAPVGSDVDAIRRALLATAAPLGDDPLTAAAQQAVPASLQAVDVLGRASANATGASGAGGTAATIGGGQQGGDDTTITSLLATAAGIIDLQIGTQVLLVSGGGFDTHSDQAARQADLLSDLGHGLATFLDTLEAQGRADQVLVVTTSEFGRRVAENGSGTDHGDGSVHFLAGPMVDGGRVVGQADLSDLVDGDLRSSIDSRSLYANALDWLSGTGGPTDDVLGITADRYALVSP